MKRTLKNVRSCWRGFGRWINSEAIPSSILKKEDLKIEDAVTEEDYFNLKKIASKNSNFDNYIGQVYYGTITPSVIKNILCNPGWYTA